jgi:hypothetical protein
MHLPSAWFKKRTKAVRTFIGPKGSIGWTFDFPESFLKEIFDGKLKPFVFSGTATYNDIFKGTPRHVTKFCYKLSALGKYSALPQPKTVFSPLINQCEKGNCTDDECKAQ